MSFEGYIILWERKARPLTWDYMEIKNPNWTPKTHWCPDDPIVLAPERDFEFV